MRKILQLDEFFLTKLHVNWHEPERERDIKAELFMDYNVARHRHEKNRFRLDFSMRIGSSKKGPKAGYEIDSQVTGIFSFPDGMKEEDMQTLIRLNGCFILYGILRGELASFTGSFPGGKFNLPTVDMQSLVEGVESRKARLIRRKRGPKKRRPERVENQKRSKKRLKKSS